MVEVLAMALFDLERPACMVEICIEAKNMIVEKELDWICDKYSDLLAAGFYGHKWGVFEGPSGRWAPMTLAKWFIEKELVN